MSKFMTEREMEALLHEETRLLAMPDGKRRTVRAFRLIWNSLDLIVRHGAFTQGQIVSLACRQADESGESFETSFERVLGYIHRKLFHA